MRHAGILEILSERFARAVAAVTGAEVRPADAGVRPAQDPRFGDYQCNAALARARGLHIAPRELAQRIVAAAELSDLVDPPQIAGAGFINVRLRADFLARYLGEIPPPPPERDEPTAGADASRIGLADRLGMAPVDVPQRVVVDYSSPNIAKSMHVGHLRSTIIGDAIVRVLMFEGHAVIRQNHVGDWGTQFGLVILGLWYTCMARRRGAGHELESWLGRLNSADADARLQAFESIRRQHEADLAQDPDGTRVFLPFLRNARDTMSIDLEGIELGYRFAVRLQEVSREAPDDPYQGLPQRVTRWLQAGEAQERLAWEYCRAATLEYCNRLYRRLGVLLNDGDVRGESDYNDRLADTVNELARRLPPRSVRQADAARAPDTGQERAAPADESEASAGAPWAELREDAGARCIYFYDAAGEPRFRGPDGAELPMIVQKSDGAYLYATTDLAAVRYRANEIEFPDGQRGATRIVYVVGSPTRLHLEMVFAAARLAGFVGPDVRLEHVSFGQVLGEDRKLLRTRSGGAVKLEELLDEAERRAAELLDQKLALEADDYRASFGEDEKRAIARRIGVAAVKYYDLARDRNSDYVFNWDRMLALQGNTAPYMMYAYARIRSIYRKALERPADAEPAAAAPIVLTHPAERALALRLARFREAIDQVAADLTPHVLCTYLYDAAGDFMRFYESCPVLQAPDEATRRSRLRLCDLTARTLRVGLWLLGIEVVERM